MGEQNSIPENTIHLCIDTSDEEECMGRIYSCMNKKPIPFQNLPTMIMIVEELLDFIGKPQSFEEKRGFFDKRYLKEEDFQLQVNQEYFYKEKGKVVTCDMIITTRKRSEWQGIVKDETGGFLRSFDTILKLLYILEKLASGRS